MDEFFVKDGEEEKGPFTFEELTDGRLEPNDLVRTTTTNWEKASDIVDFTEYFKYEGYYFPTETNLASFGIRVLAFLIDHLIYSFTIAIGISVYNNFQMAGQLFDVTKPEDFSTLRNIIAPIAFVSYNLVCLVLPISATLGQLICKLIVVDADGRKLNIVKALIRSVGKLLSFMFFFLGFISVLFSQYKQAFHDAIAKTYVIRKDVF